MSLKKKERRKEMLERLVWAVCKTILYLVLWSVLCGTTCLYRECHDFIFWYVPPLVPWYVVALVGIDRVGESSIMNSWLISITNCFANYQGLLCLREE